MERYSTRLAFAGSGGDLGARGESFTTDAGSCPATTVPSSAPRAMAPSPTPR